MYNIIYTFYYPSPYGSHNQLEVYRSVTYKPVNKDTLVNPREGELVYNGNDRSLYLYNSTYWIKQGGAGLPCANGKWFAEEEPSDFYGEWQKSDRFSVDTCNGDVDERYICGENEAKSCIDVRGKRDDRAEQRKVICRATREGVRYSYYCPS
ncbi:MAG: hypothetical protein QMD94_03425 [Candidatus Omnitrophota bacterium]|nr:hypothetical protein [Candidatus Omnitrophota bacterium]